MCFISKTFECDPLSCCFSSLFVCWLCVWQLVALDIGSFKEEDLSAVKLQKHIRELSDQLYRNVSLRARNHSYISSAVSVLYQTYCIQNRCSHFSILYMCFAVNSLYI